MDTNKIKYNKIRKSAYNISEDFAYVLGVEKGDGHCFLRRSEHGTTAGITLKVKDVDFADHFKKVVERWSGIKSRLYKVKNSNLVRVDLSSIEVAKFIKSFDMKNILGADKRVRNKFLQGLFDSEGGVVSKNLDNRKYAIRRIHFFNSDKTLIDIISFLLNELNIRHKLKKRRNSGFGSKKLQYSILIHDKNSIYNYFRNVNFNIKRKKYKLEEILKSYTVYPVSMYKEAKLLHKSMGYRKVAQKLGLNPGITYGWLFKNNKKQIVNWGKLK